MNSHDDDRFDAAFADLAETAALMAEPADTAVLRGRVRRRRTTRGAVAAAAAALLVAAPSVWLLQNAQGEEVTPPAEETTVIEPAPTTSEVTTAPEETPETTNSTEAEPEGPEPPGFEDLIGEAIDLPSLGEYPDDVCPSEDAVLTEVDGDGLIFLMKVVHARLVEGGPIEAVALVGCRPGEAMIRQAVVIAEADGGGFEVTEQLYAFGDHGSVYDVAPDAEYGVLLGFLETEPCCETPPESLDRWIERYRDGALEELTGDVPGTHITDLAPTFEITDSGENTWELAITVTNLGENDAARFELDFCSEELVNLVGENQICYQDRFDGETVDGLAAGDTYTTIWTIEAAPAEEWDDYAVQYGVYFSVEIDMPRYGVDALVFETTAGNDRQTYFIEYEMLD